MTTHKYSRATAVTLCCLLAGPVLAQDTTVGQVIAEKRCARCHAIKAGEKSQHRLAPPFSVIANRYSVWGLQEALAEGIIVGHADMPKFVLSPEEINSLLAFMDTFTRQKSKTR